MVIKLQKALEHDKRTIEEIIIDLDALTPLDIKFCLAEAKAATGIGENVLPLLENAFHEQVAARLSGLPVEALNKLTGADYLRVTQRVRLFFVALD